MKRKNAGNLMAFAAAAAVFLTGCSGAPESAGTTTDTLSASETASEMFTDRDFEIGFDLETAVQIELSGTSAVCTSKTVTVDGSTATISEEGTYIVAGTLSDGMIVVDADDADKIQIVLSGAEISNADGAAIYVKNADKVFVTTADGSVNTLANGGEYASIDENNIDAVIFSKSDLTLNGAGTLTLDAAAGHGAVSKDDLVIASGTYVIEAASHALSGKDSVRIAGGNFTINAGKDGIHAENADDTDQGFVYIADGTFSVVAAGDGFSAQTTMVVENGVFEVMAGGGSANAPAHTENTMFGHGGMHMNSTEETQTDTVSTKGFKAGTSLTFNAGVFSIDTADDALHSNGDLTVSNGEFTISTGDDGAHADGALIVLGGIIEIAESYEGLEGLSIEIAGGEIDITASDDGLNAAGGSDGSGTGLRNDMFAATEGAEIRISDGIVSINASGDGIDSNGDLIVTGGEVYVSGSESGGDSALDYTGNAEISGGLFVAAGMSGMAQNFASSSTQGVMMVSVGTQASGSWITLADADENVIVSWQTEKMFDSVIVSSPRIEQGGEYTLTAGTSTMQVSMTALVYSSGGADGGRRETDGRISDPMTGEAPDAMPDERHEVPLEDRPQGNVPAREFAADPEAVPEQAA